MKIVGVLAGCAALLTGCATRPGCERVEPVRERTVTQEPGLRDYNPVLQEFERPWPYGSRDTNP